jgi:hypothetical protein
MSLYVLRLRDGNCIVADAPSEESQRTSHTAARDGLVMCSDLIKQGERSYGALIVR